MRDKKITSNVSTRANCQEQNRKDCAAICHNSEQYSNKVNHRDEYSRPYLLIHDRRSDFIGKNDTKCVRMTAAKALVISTRNPQTNAIVERVH